MLEGRFCLHVENLEQIRAFLYICLYVCVGLVVNLLVQYCDLFRSDIVGIVT